MAVLQGNLPTDVRRPGVFNFFDDTSTARGQIPIARTIGLIGMKHASGTAALNVPIEVVNELFADLLFGIGSELALMCRQAFRTFRFLSSRIRGFAAQVWAVPIADPGGGAVAATRTFTVTGTATQAGDVIIRIAGREIRAPVKVGDTQNTTAAAIKAAIDQRLIELPGTATVAANVVTFVYRHLGVNGNDLLTSTVQSVAGVTVAAAVGATGTGVADIQLALDAMVGRHFRAIAIANHAAADVVDLGEHADAMWAADVKKYRHMFLASTGTLATATTLAAPANRKEILVISFEGGRNLPGEIAASVAAMTQTKERPSQNWDKTELPLFPTDDVLNYSAPELESALAGGVTPLEMTDVGGVRVNRLVTTKATHNGVAFENLRDFAVSATSAFYALQTDAAVSQEMAGRNVTEELIGDIRARIYGVLKDGESLGDLHNVDAHAAEILVQPHPSIATRIVTDIPVSVTPNAHQVDNTFRLHIEAPQVAA